MGRKVLIACDDSPHSRIMVDVAFSHAVHHAIDEIHLVTVVPLVGAAVTVFPMAPMATAATVAAVQHGAEMQRAAEIEKANHTLKLISDLIVVDYRVPRDSMHMHVLPSEGGASGASEAVLHFAREHKVDLVVVGCRGMGAIKRSLMSLVGLGSVSDAILQASPCPVLLVRWDPARVTAHAAEAQPAPLAPVPKKVCVAFDESPASEAALLWALDSIVTAHDHLHLVSVALTAPIPILDEPAAVIALQAQTARDQAEQAVAAASVVVEKAVEIAVSHGVTRTKVTSDVLNPIGGPNDIGAAICEYAKSAHVDVVVCGSRGMGAFKRSVMSFLGLGSVSEYLAHNLHCALAVVREGTDLSKDDARASENVAFHVIPEGTGEDGEEEQPPTA